MEMGLISRDHKTVLKAQCSGHITLPIYVHPRGYKYLEVGENFSPMLCYIQIDLFELRHS
jgi:hypothetical protein